MITSEKTPVRFALFQPLPWGKVPIGTNSPSISMKKLPPTDGLLTVEDFDKVAKKYFEDIEYDHKSSSYLELKDGKYTAIGWSDHGFYIYEVTKLEKSSKEDGKDKWKAYITGYYFYELDADPSDPPSAKSKNAQAVLKEMKKPDYTWQDFLKECDRLVWNNPGAILEPDCDWVIEFTVNDAMGDIYFTYLSCERRFYNR